MLGFLVCTPGTVSRPAPCRSFGPFFPSSVAGKRAGLGQRSRGRHSRVTASTTEGKTGATDASLQSAIGERLTKWERVAEVLRADLPGQYNEQFDMDFSVYAPEVTFDDPWTKLNGKLQYRGMLYGIWGMRKLFFSDAVFHLYTCDLLKEESKIRTTWRAYGKLFYGKELELTGTDYFHLNDDGLITRHESLWDDKDAESG